MLADRPLESGRFALRLTWSVFFAVIRTLEKISCYVSALKGLLGCPSIMRRTYRCRFSRDCRSRSSKVPISSGNVGGILCTYAEGYERACVPQDGMAYFGLKLVQVLVRHREAHAVLAQLGEHVRDRKRGEALELIDIGKEIAPRLGC